MFLHCQKGCHRRGRRYSDGVLAFEGALASREGSSNTAHRVAAPPGMEKAYHEMVALVADFGQAPTLEFYDDLHGVGGLFIPDEWVIAIGVKDIEDIADSVLSARSVEVTRIATELSPRIGHSPNAVRNLMIAAGMGRCAAHELGHAVIFKGWINPFAPDGEAGADYYAGRFDAARGADRRLGEMFFRAIGCIGPTCDHPAPETRSKAYLVGYREQQQRAGR